MTPHDAALTVLRDGPLTQSSIVAAVRAALLVAEDRLPIPSRRIGVVIDRRSKATLGSMSFRRVRRDGEVEHIPHEVTISMAVAALAGIEELADTIAHEIAHAIAGREANHDINWRTVARQMGATPERCASNPAVKRAHRYAIICVPCDRVLSRYATKCKPRRCRTCGESAYTVNVNEECVVIEATSPSAMARLDDDRDALGRILTPVVEDYREAWDDITTLSKTA